MNLAALLFISPWIIGLIVFTACPVVYSGELSLTDYDVINDPNSSGSPTTARWSTTRRSRWRCSNTFIFTVMYGAHALVVALALALLLRPGGSRVRILPDRRSSCPKMTPAVAVGGLFLLLLNGQSGLREPAARLGRDQPAQLADRPDLGQAGHRPDEAVEHRRHR